jgi:sec-independent protein translocase protein TatB
MDIFGIGILELVFILIIAMIVVGPRDLGKVGRQVGRFLNRMYKSESWRMLNEAFVSPARRHWMNSIPFGIASKTQAG